MKTEIYWLTRLDSLKVFLGFLTLLCLVFIIVNLIKVYIEWDSGEEDESKKYITNIRNMIIMGSFFILFNCLIPSTNDAVKIYVGGEVAEYIKKDTALQQIPHSTSTLINELINKGIEKVKEQ